MSYQGSLESIVKVGKTKIGLGDPKPEVLMLVFGGGKTKELKRKEDGYAEQTITFAASDGEQPDVAVVSADAYELKYTDSGAKDDVSTTHVQYKPKDGEWIDLDSVHVFKARKGVVDISPLCEVKFRVLGKAIPKDKPVQVEVYLGTSEVPPSSSTSKQSN